MEIIKNIAKTLGVSSDELIFDKSESVASSKIFGRKLFGKDTISARLQKHWINLDFVLVTSIDIIKEINRVFHYPRIQQRFNVQKETLKRFFRLIFRKAIIRNVDEITSSVLNLH